MLVNQSIVADIKTIIISTREKAKSSVDHERTLMYWHIGKCIFEEEQQGKDRAAYGEYLTKYVSEQLEPEFGIGFSKRQIELFRQFYHTFPVDNTLYPQLEWIHYKILIRIESTEKRDFYISETIRNNWTARQLDHHIYSSLWETLFLSTEGENVLALASDESMPANTKELNKETVYLEFVELDHSAFLCEKDLEQAIIARLHDFLLELGNDFTFVTRQKRLHEEGDEFFMDLVYYDRLLKSFVIIETKTAKPTDQDIPRLQVHVNHYNRYEK
jgi:predicted nuclease of restriction endonuclease-like (RecB) superfamily